jgi:uncharacterized membrane protein YhaH (DUF805 family)
MANLFMGIIVFRLVMGGQTLLESPAGQSFVAAFLGGAPTGTEQLLISPLIYASLGILISLANLLFLLVRRGAARNG